MNDRWRRHETDEGRGVYSKIETEGADEDAPIWSSDVWSHICFWKEKLTATYLGCAMFLDEGKVLFTRFFSLSSCRITMDKAASHLINF